MNFEEHFNDIKSFLIKYHDIWFSEVIIDYPNSMTPYPKEWIEELDTLSNEDLWRIDCRDNYHKLGKSSLKNTLEEIRKLTKLERFDVGELEKLPSWAFQKVKQKKVHEILTLSKVVREIVKREKIDHLIDIGGGVGHLARTLAHYFGIKCISLDQNKDFQEIGKKRLKKYPLPQDANEVEFINITFGSEEAKLKLKPVFTNSSISLGLHTCGPLANKHFETSLYYKEKGLLNFGCCYLKMNPNTDVNLSKYSKDSKLDLSKFSLTLATRGHTEISYEDFVLKTKVKYYRYALHILLYERYAHREFKTVGPANELLYSESFSTYAFEKMNYLNLEIKETKDELDSFFNSVKIQQLLRQFFLANIIRWQFGRVVEHYILSDRCLFLEENGHEVSMKEYFDEKLSPRNIGILAFNK